MDGRSARALMRVVSLVALSCVCAARDAHADAVAPPPWWIDRGDGMPTSMFGTYAASGERLAYLFYEYTLNRDQEYKPAELGYGVEHDYRARRVDHEALVFLARGWSNVEVELESALFTTATQRRSALDPSAMPARLTESGLGDTEGQVRWRWVRETARRPELFGAVEVVAPLQRTRRLIGTQDWELAHVFGAIKGCAWGTVQTHASVSYADHTLEFGEWEVEYLRRTSPRWRWVAAVEGEQDEVAAIAEAQLRLAPWVTLKLNDAIGLTGKAPDQAPEVGLLFSFR